MLTRGAVDAMTATMDGVGGELKKIYTGITNSFGTTFEMDPGKFMREQKEVEDAPTSRRATVQFGKGAHVVDFTDSKGKTYPVLEPGVDCLFSCQIIYQGNRTADFLEADKRLDSAKQASKKNANTVWHHYHDYDPRTNTGTMCLMEKDKHNVFHYGGMYQFNGT